MIKFTDLANRNIQLKRDGALALVFALIVVANACTPESQDAQRRQESAEPGLEEVPASDTSTVIQLSQPVIFTRSDGGMGAVDAGIYNVQRVSERELLLVPDRRGDTAVRIRAQSIDHEQALLGPEAISETLDEGEHHVLLLLPDGTGLGATGSHSGVITRGVEQTLNRTRVESSMARRYSTGRPVLAQSQQNAQVVLDRQNFYRQNAHTRMQMAKNRAQRKQAYIAQQVQQIQRTRPAPTSQPSAPEYTLPSLLMTGKEAPPPVVLELPESFAPREFGLPSLLMTGKEAPPPVVLELPENFEPREFALPTLQMTGK